jgi:hypothetical protein
MFTMFDLLIAIVAVLLLGLADFMVATGALRAILNVVLGPFFPALKYNAWISNIPGNPTCLDHLIAAFFGPFPENNDFNSVLTGEHTSLLSQSKSSSRSSINHPPPYTTLSSNTQAFQ